ncbi:MAG: ParB N-terminal domain-containing protein [Planctomycetia bacterium]|nr:ParB N-terminal domain-containing protein [Planctomycetia bacterium]
MAIGTITVSSNHRHVKPAVVKALVDSIREIGLQHPIGVTKSGTLIHGRHRLEAYRQMQKATIPVIVHDLDELHAELAELDENLLRHGFTAIEEAKALKRRKQVYEALHPETKRGGDKGNQHTGGKARQNESVSFSQDTATKTGRSARAVQLDVALADAIPDEVAEAIADSPVADNKAELKKLAALPADEQSAVAEKLADGSAKTVNEARGGKPRKNVTKTKRASKPTNAATLKLHVPAEDVAVRDDDADADECVGSKVRETLTEYAAVLTDEDVRTLKQAEQEAKQQQTLESDCKRLVRAMGKYPEGETESALRRSAGMSGTRFQLAIDELVGVGHAVECGVTKPNRKKPYPAYRLLTE